MIWIVLTAIFLFVVLLYLGRGYWAWVSSAALLLFASSRCHSSCPPCCLFWGYAALATFALLFGLPPIRRLLITRWIMKLMAGFLPRIGQTERIALEAGTVWWDGELFSGKPNWKKLLDFKIQELSPTEKAFLDGPVESLCDQLNEWEIEKRGDLFPEHWAFIKKHKFMGMIIPEKYGGLGFSAMAHSAVITKLSSRSVTAAVTVMVPNSLGPAELLLHYGTEAQKNHFLPRLACGEEIPCFALTGPEAGSDAAATQSTGVVCKGKYEGKEILGMRLNWRKRYITLGPVSTIIGLAFRMLDPDHLLGAKEDLGITCALIPSKLPGIDIGKHHDPMGIPFSNGPNSGRDVFVPLDFIIGGPDMAGHGWRMLMQSLAAGRSISLPSLSDGIAQVAVRTSGAYATIREQFDTPIGRFEGIEEALARIGGFTYLMNAARTITASAVDSGEKPAVVSAIVKAYLTELMRFVVNDAMDIRAGSAICRGPRNNLEPFYRASPIGITVEGANILTRCMIIYGQGAIRCHPYAAKEMEAVAQKDLAGFDRAFFKHVNFVMMQMMRALFLGLTRSRLACAPIGGPSADYFRHLTYLSSAFALISDVAMATLGGKLKRREKISGRLADMLAWMYLASATLKFFHHRKSPPKEVPFLRWTCEYSLYQVQTALIGVLDNLPNRLAACLVKLLILPLGAVFKMPSDNLGSAVARNLLEDHEGRLALTENMYVPKSQEVGLGRMEAALEKAVLALQVETKIRDAVRSGRLDHAPGDALVEHAFQAGVITREEVNILKSADAIRDEVIQVDAF